MVQSRAIGVETWLADPIPSARPTSDEPASAP